MSEPANVVHLPTKPALKRIIELCIARGNDEQFSSWVEKTQGFEVFSKHALWRAIEGLTVWAANGELFPAGSADQVEFEMIFEEQGRAAARQWMSKRLIRSDFAPVSGRRADGNTQRVYWRAVGSKLEPPAKTPRTKRRETVRLMEDT